MNLASIGIRASAGLHPEVEAFVNASYANITDAGIITDLNTLVGALKGYGLWTPMRAVYPLVGGNATAHSYNLKDVTQHQITWNGTVTHNANGVTGNGTTGYGNTGIVPSSVLSSSVHVSAYIRVSSATFGQYDIFCGSDASSCLGFCSNQSGGSSFAVNNGEIGGLNVTPPAFISLTRSAANVGSIYRNGSKFSNFTRAQISMASVPLAIMAKNIAGAISGYSAKNYAFFTVGDSLTDTQCANLYTAIQAFQTSRGRQV